MKHIALFSCQIEGCREEVSYPADMLHIFRDKPICQECFEDGAGEQSEDWHNLLPFVPQEVSRIAELEAVNGELTEALGFAASVIKSGESWTGTCERVIGNAIARATIAKARRET